MPQGKIAARLGGVGWVNRATLTIDAFEMRRLAKRGVAPLEMKVMEKHSRTLSDAFREYQIKRRGAVTATSRYRVMNLISKRAGKVLQAPKNEKWKNNLLDALNCRLGKDSWRNTASGHRVPVRDTQFRVIIDHFLLEAHRQNSPPTAQLKDLKRALDGRDSEFEYDRHGFEGYLGNVG